MKFPGTKLISFDTTFVLFVHTSFVRPDKVCTYPDQYYS